MKTIVTTYWQIDIPDDWVDEHEGDVVSLYAKQGVGTVQISAAVQERPLRTSDLRNIAAEHIEAGAKTEDITLGDFQGFTLSYSSDNDYWREWYLLAEELMLFITYDCDLGDEGQEEDIVEAILETLLCK